MGIKVTVPKGSEDKPYPKLMINRLNDTIVLMVSKGVGMVVREGNNCNPVGIYIKDWRESYFTDYNEPLTLQNE